jgi:hypothetical protein
MKRLIYVGLILGTLFIFPIFCFADDIIQGHYCYTYGDNESLREAREVTRTLAIRNAIESYRTFITSASTIKNFQLTNDLVQIISSGYLKDIKVIEYKEEGRTICETIQAGIQPQAVENIVKEARSKIEKSEEIGLANNGFLKILGSRGEKYEPTRHKSRTVLSVTIKFLKDAVDYSVSNKNHRYLTVCVDFYDEAGNAITGDSHNFGGSPILQGEIRSVEFSIPYHAKSWRIWLPTQYPKK